MYHNLKLLRQGAYASLYHYLGALKRGDGTGTCLRVWAPNADRVSVLGEFKGCTSDERSLVYFGDSSVWKGELCGVGTGELAKYRIRNRRSGDVSEAAYPLAFNAERSPCTASVITRTAPAQRDGCTLRKRSSEMHSNYAGKQRAQC